MQRAVRPKPVAAMEAMRRGSSLPVGVVGGGAVEDLAGVGAGLLGEEEAGAALHVVEEGFVGGVRM